VYYERKIYDRLQEISQYDPLGRLGEQEPEGDDQEGGRINMDDPVMQKTGWWKDNPELTVGGVLKQGDKHPAYKDARDIVDKERGGESDEKPEPKQTKIAANPFDDDPASKPAAQDEPEAKPAAADADLSDPKQMKQAIFKQYPDLAKMAKDPKTAGMVDKLFDPEYQSAAEKDLDTEPELPDSAQDLDPITDPRWFDDDDIDDEPEAYSDEYYAKQEREAEYHNANVIENDPPPSGLIAKGDDGEPYSPIPKYSQNEREYKKKLKKFDAAATGRPGWGDHDELRKGLGDMLATAGARPNKDGQYATDDGRIMSRDSIIQAVRREMKWSFGAELDRHEVDLVLVGIQGDGYRQNDPDYVPIRSDPGHPAETKQPFKEQYNRLFESLGGI